jgi:hypothetical protein
MYAELAEVSKKLYELDMRLASIEKLMIANQEVIRLVRETLRASCKKLEDTQKAAG